jgi:phosphohistidine phosphatase
MDSKYISELNFISIVELLILRHGEAGKRNPSGTNDAKRPLTVVGEKEIAKIAEALKVIGVRLDIILTSPLKRAQQTANIVAKEFKAHNKIEQLQELSPEGNRSALYHKLSSFREGTSILLVGHNPYLSEMVSELVTDEKKGRIDLKKGGIARIRVTSAAPKFKGELKWLVSPKLLKLISKG